MSAALDVLGSLVLEDGRRWGAAATSWQRADAAAVLDPQGPRLHLWTRPRGGSKTSDAAGLALGWLTEEAPAGGRGFVVAVDAEQAGELLDAARGFVARTPGLAPLLVVESQRIVNVRSGASVVALASDGAGAYGRRPLLTIVDEAANWPGTRTASSTWTAVVSGVPKAKDGRLLVVTSPGDPAHRSHRLLVHARASEQWRVSEVPGPLPWVRAEDLVEQRVLLSEWEFRRLHLGEWAAADDRLVDLSRLRECVTLDRWPLPCRPGQRYSLGLDLGLTSDRTVLAVVHAERSPGGAAPRVVLDRMHVWQGTRGRPVQLADVEAVVLEASRGYGRAPVVADPWQAAGLAQRLRGQGVRVEEFAFSSGSVGRLARVLHTLLRDARLALPDDPDLLDELGNVRLIETSPGVVRMDHDRGRHDDRAVALALAALPLVTAASGQAWASTPRSTLPTAHQLSAAGAGVASLLRPVQRPAAVAVGRTVVGWRGPRRGVRR